MYRYLALIWNSANQQQSDAARFLLRRVHSNSPELRGVVEANGLRVFHAGDRALANQACLLQDNAGVVLGALFERPRDENPVPPRVALSVGETDRIVTSGGRTLTEDYWGRYVAFIRNEVERKSYVIRDPTGALPCFGTRFQGVDIYFSRADDCLALGVLRFTINWRYVAAHLPLRLLQINDTGLTEVTEVQPGESVETMPDRTRRTILWNPVRISEADTIEDAALAATALRLSAKACVNAWASCYNSIIHTLSGGLDSSIVLACLHNAPSRPKITCVNYFTSTPEGDERVLARLAAVRASCDLLEEQRNAANVRLDAICGIARSPKPWLYWYYLEHGQFESRIAQEKDATAIFSGGGGDGLFFQAKAGYGATDFVRRHGIRTHLFKIALDTAYLERKSLWSVLGSALRDGLIKRRWTPDATMDKTQTLISRELLSALDFNEFAHPWLKSAALIPPGKLWQILSVSIPPSYYDPFGNMEAPERVHPLVSQPLIEACLRIPTYVLTAGGWDRAIARRAFSQDLPREIVTRRAKGGINEHAKSIFEHNIAFVRAFLLDGILVKQGYLDRPRLEACLSLRRASLGHEFAEIDAHMSTEAWLRSWTGAALRAAA